MATFLQHEKRLDKILSNAVLPFTLSIEDHTKQVYSEHSVGKLFDNDDYGYDSTSEDNEALQNIIDLADDDTADAIADVQDAQRAVESMNRFDTHVKLNTVIHGEYPTTLCVNKITRNLNLTTESGTITPANEGVGKMVKTGLALAFSAIRKLIGKVLNLIGRFASIKKIFLVQSKMRINKIKKWLEDNKANMNKGISSEQLEKVLGDKTGKYIAERVTGGNSLPLSEIFTSTLDVVAGDDMYNTFTKKDSINKIVGLYKSAPPQKAIVNLNNALNSMANVLKLKEPKHLDVKAVKELENFNQQWLTAKADIEKMFSDDKATPEFKTPEQWINGLENAINITNTVCSQIPSSNQGTALSKFSASFIKLYESVAQDAELDKVLKPHFDILNTSVLQLYETGRLGYRFLGTIDRALNRAILLTKLDVPSSN